MTDPNNTPREAERMSDAEFHRLVNKDWHSEDDNFLMWRDMVVIADEARRARASETAQAAEIARLREVLETSHHSFGNYILRSTTPERPEKRPSWAGSACAPEGGVG